jgi:hypothetical protein
MKPFRTWCYASAIRRRQKPAPAALVHSGARLFQSDRAPATNASRLLRNAAAPAARGESLIAGGAPPNQGAAAPAKGGASLGAGEAAPALGGEAPAAGGAPLGARTALRVAGGAPPTAGGATPATGAAPVCPENEPIALKTSVSAAAGADGSRFFRQSNKTNNHKTHETK